MRINALVLCVLAGSACASDPGQVSSDEQDGVPPAADTVQDMAPPSVDLEDILQANGNANYQPLTPPEAVELAELIVVGRFVDLHEGRSFEQGSGNTYVQRYLGAQFEVDKTLKGAHEDTVYMEFVWSDGGGSEGVLGPEKLVAFDDNPEAIALLMDPTPWSQNVVENGKEGAFYYRPVGVQALIMERTSGVYQPMTSPRDSMIFAGANSLDEIEAQINDVLAGRWVDPR